MTGNIELHEGDAFLLVDMQKDFCPGGALAIENGDKIVPVINKWVERFIHHQLPVLASRDWHPRNHVSFASEGGRWPPHCIQDTAGAEFHEALHLPQSAIIVTKGVRFDQDQNSAFDQTGLGVFLKRKGVCRLFIAGLALDVCVLATAIDARAMGFEVVLLSEATRPVDPGKGNEALARMQKARVQVIQNDQTHANVAQKPDDNLELCLKAPEWAEHQRFDDGDMPCDDGRAG